MEGVKMVFKKDIKPIGGKRARVDVYKGKGATEQRTAPRERESLTSAAPMDRMMNRYPAAPQPAPNAAPQPPGGTIGPRPTAAMPPDIE
jgi:hypothetical protein